MFRACGRCGKIHPKNQPCNKWRVYSGGNDRTLRGTYSWKLKREQIKERAHYLCEVCKDKGEINYKDLEVHHITKLTENEDLLLDNYNLICLCSRCHRLADDGKIDKDYLLELARKREDGST